jgi:hypothetical protein
MNALVMIDIAIVTAASTKLALITRRAPRPFPGNAGRVRPTAASTTAQTTKTAPAM